MFRASARLPLLLEPLQILGSDAVVPPDPDGRELFLADLVPDRNDLYVIQIRHLITA